MGSVVVREDEREFMPVDWGETKNLFGPENVGARYLKINITEYAPGTEHRLHMHLGQEEVVLVLEGGRITRTDGGDKPIKKGAFVSIPADTDHATINILKDRPMKAIIVKSPPDEGRPK